MRNAENASPATGRLDLLSGRGAVLAEYHSHDWTASSVGHPDAWPVLLRNSVNLILDSLFPMFVVWGPKLAFLYNAAYIPIMESKHPASLGAPLKEVWPEIWSGVQPLLESAFAGEPTFGEDIARTITRDGRRQQCWFNISYSPIREDNGRIPGVLCVINETTARVRLERRQALQLQVVDRLRYLTSVEEITEATSEMLGRHLDVPHVFYSEVDDAANRFQVRRDWARKDAVPLTGRTGSLNDYGPQVIALLRRGRPLLVGDVRNDERTSAHAAAYESLGVRAILAFPLVRDRKLIATWNVYDSEPHYWSQDDLRIAEDIADRVWSAVERVRAESALREEAQILELLKKTGEAAASTLELRVLMQSITDTATQLSGARFGAFFYNTSDAQEDALMLYTLSGAPREAFEGFGQPRATSVFGPTFRGGPPVRSDDITKDARYGQWGPHHGMPPGHLPVRSYLAVPVMSHTGEVVGGLFFGHPDASIFSERTERLVAGIATQAGMALDNARLYEASQQAATERAVLLERERATRTELERLNKMKDEFLAMLAHELRNPLAPIASAAEVLRLLFDSDSKIQQSVSVIRRQVAHLTRLVDDLLDVSRVTRGVAILQEGPVSLNEVVGEALEQVRSLASAKHQSLVAHMPPESVLVQGDRTRLIQAVSNVFNNAIKFTAERGHISVRLEANASQVELSVEDDGVGIAADLMPHVFDLFTQAVRSPDRSQGGLGLGLALVKSLLELHGGSVSAHSDGVGSGSRFLMKLPRLRNDASGDQAPRGGPQREEQTGELRLVVVDDNEDAADSLAALLKAIGHEVQVLYSARRALEVVPARPPACLFLDIGLPDMDGYALARRLRALPELSDSMLVAVTGYGQAEDYKRAMEAGFDRHMVKPVELNALLELLDEVKRTQH
jgi:signal transduction histidine kinase/ActR/RegA family two-component response regulator